MVVSRTLLDHLLLQVLDRFPRPQHIGRDLGRRLAEQLLVKPIGAVGDVETLKLACKVLWPALFGKQADKLQTNKQGLFYIHDTAISWNSLHSDQDRVLLLTGGVLEGFLRGCGLEGATVSGEQGGVFNIQTR
jgi:hypothetical protein